MSATLFDIICPFLKDANKSKIEAALQETLGEVRDKIKRKREHFQLSRGT